MDNLLTGGSTAAPYLYAGCDVSADTLDLARQSSHGSCEHARFSNDPAGHAQLTEWLTEPGLWPDADLKGYGLTRSEGRDAPHLQLTRVALNPPHYAANRQGKVDSDDEGGKSVKMRSACESRLASPIAQRLQERLRAFAHGGVRVVPVVEDG